ncbi:MAG: class I SAM-dependent methyltransferase [Verrucomicrobia bacterium]|nr:class I SAM-dependent methyltransferase [Verrucomicrobiota bacterium]
MPDNSSHHLRALPAGHVQFIEQLIIRCGPEPHEYEALHRWFEHTAEHVREGRITRDAVAAFWQEVTLAHFPDSMQGHVVRKPHGYAGDFEIIDRIYLGHINEDERVKRWDSYFHAQHSPRAVRNRKIYFHDLLRRKLNGTTNRPLRVLNVASGPARDLAEWCAAHGTEEVHFDCVEMDTNAIAHAQSLCAPYERCVHFMRANALRFTTNAKYDLVWSAGLFDYLSDSLFVRLLKRLMRFTREGGEVVIGNFGNFNPTRFSMETWCNWHLIHRGEDDVTELGVSAGIEAAEVRIGREPEGVNLFLHINVK